MSGKIILFLNRLIAVPEILQKHELNRRTAYFPIFRICTMWRGFLSRIFSVRRLNRIPPFSQIGPLAFASGSSTRLYWRSCAAQSGFRLVARNSLPEAQLHACFIAISFDLGLSDSLVRSQTRPSLLWQKRTPAHNSSASAKSIPGRKFFPPAQNIFFLVAV